MDGLATARACLRSLTLLADHLRVNEEALLRGFTPGVFATDRALELVARGRPFRDAYQHVKEHLDELETEDPRAAIAKKTHLGGTAGLDFDAFDRRIDAGAQWAKDEWTGHCRAVSKLMRTPYPVR
jgi:argininosuccinate lyase